MNIELLNKIKEAIRKEPKQFYMHDFFTQSLIQRGVKEIPNCGTAACIAGWAVALALDKNPAEAYHHILASKDIYTWIEARKLLGLTQQQESNLFYTDNWPCEFDADYNDAIRNSNFTLAAEVACKRIDHFINTGI